MRTNDYSYIQCIAKGNLCEIIDVCIIKNLCFNKKYKF